jgi:ABC-type nitrate/sulfonate/bicarbonate transport system permease component
MTVATMTLVEKPVRSRRPTFNFVGVATFLTALAVWQVAAVRGPMAGTDALPSPVEVGKGFAQLIDRGVLLDDVAHTVYVTALASAIGISIGLVLGLLLGLVPVFRLFTETSFDVLRTMPIVALMPLALLLWGGTFKSELILASFATVWPTLVNTAGGVRGVHPRLAEVGRVFQFSRFTVLRKLTLPATAPHIAVGARLSIITALIVTIVTEMLVSPHGLGWRLTSAQQALEYDQMWAAVIASGVIGLVLNLLLVAAINRMPGSGGRR